FGDLGCDRALVYTVLGAADVALTEALVGTLLAITLYAVAVRSSLVLRLGVLKDSPEDDTGDPQVDFSQLMDELQTVFDKRHMRVELVPYADSSELHQALMAKEVHATCARSQPKSLDASADEDRLHSYHTTTRLRRIYEIMQLNWLIPTYITYVSTPDSGEHIHEMALYCGGNCVLYQNAPHIQPVPDLTIFDCRSSFAR
ncbi:MAG: hypothetical protein HC856_06510, partial [Pseudanabaena sp. RU_4_16]|nr:hypothetical protein [Pseudanabaena sp. RU_4_16]